MSPPIDRAALQSAVNAAQGAHDGNPPVPPAQTQRIPAGVNPRNPVLRQTGSMGGDAQAAMGAAVMAAAEGAPAAASAGPSGGTARPQTLADRMAAIKEATGDKFPVLYNKAEMDLSVEEAQKYAQKGLRAANLEEEKAQMRADKEGWAAFQGWKSYLANPANAVQAKAIQDIYEGRRPATPAAPARQASGYDQYGELWIDDEVVSAKSAQADPTVAAIEARMKRMESLMEGQARYTREEGFKSQMNSVIAEDPFLNSDPETAELARELISSGVTAGVYQSVDEAKTVVSHRLRRMVSAEAEATRSRRDLQSQQHATIPPAGGRSPLIEDAPAIGSTSKDLRNSKGLIKDWIRRGRSAATSGPGG